MASGDWVRCKKCRTAWTRAGQGVCPRCKRPRAEMLRMQRAGIKGVMQILMSNAHLAPKPTPDDYYRLRKAAKNG